MLPVPMTPSFVFASTLFSAPDSAAAPSQEAVRKIFDDVCTMCHSGDGSDSKDPGALGLDGDLTRLAGIRSAATDKMLVVPGDPEASYLLDKVLGTPAMKGDLMPQDMDPLTPAQIKAVRDWISALPKDAASNAGNNEGPSAGAGEGAGQPSAPPKRKVKPFHGTDHIVLPTTTTLGKQTLQYRIDHRFGRIGTERGAFGLDAGVIMSMGMAYGILDGWDVRLRRTNSRKGWELGTKYVPLRQEEGRPVSLGIQASVSWFRDFDVANPWTGDFQLMLSRLWFVDRWATMLTAGYSLRTNHATRVIVDFKDGRGPVLAKDTRDTFDLGFATSVYLGRRRQWGIDLEWLLPIPDGAVTNKFYYRGGDANPDGSKIGAWSIGGSYTTGKHFFQVFFTNNREIHTNLAAPGGQSGNPFKTPGVDSKNPFLKANFFLGFNLGRNFTLGKRVNAKRERQKKEKASEGASARVAGTKGGV